MTVTCQAPVEKFQDYLFKPGATHGKDHVFRALGYSRANSVILAVLYERQAAEKYAHGDYVLGRLDEHGQRVTIEIALPGADALSERISYLATGWMIQADGSLRLNTPFTGFTR